MMPAPTWHRCRRRLPEANSVLGDIAIVSPQFAFGTVCPEIGAGAGNNQVHSGNRARVEEVIIRSKPERAAEHVNHVPLPARDHEHVTHSKASGKDIVVRSCTSECPNPGIAIISNEAKSG